MLGIPEQHGQSTRIGRRTSGETRGSRCSWGSVWCGGVGRSLRRACAILTTETTPMPPVIRGSPEGVQMWNVVEVNVAVQSKRSMKGATPNKFEHKSPSLKMNAGKANDWTRSTPHPNCLHVLSIGRRQDCVGRRGWV